MNTVNIKEVLKRLGLFSNPDTNGMADLEMLAKILGKPKLADELHDMWVAQLRTNLRFREIQCCLEGHLSEMPD